MDAFAFQRVEIDRQRCHQRLAFTGPHFGDFTAMQHHPADHLDVKVTHAKHPLGGFTNRGERFGQQIVERLALVQHPPEFRGLGLQLFIAECGKRRLVSGDQINCLAERFDVAIVRRSKKGLGDGTEHS